MLARVESRSRDEIHLEQRHQHVNDKKTAHPGLSNTRGDAVVTGGSLFLQGGSVGGYVQPNTAGAAVNDALDRGVCGRAVDDQCRRSAMR